MGSSTFKRFVLLVAIAAAALTVFLVAGSAGVAGDRGAKLRYRFDEVTRAATVWQSADFPAPGSTWVAALLNHSHQVFPSGEEREARGAQRFVNEIVAWTSINSATFKSRAVGYFGNAKIYKKQHGTATFQPDGSLEVVGEGTITGGTGTRRGTRAHYTFKGYAPSLEDPLVTRVKGAGIYSDR